MPSKTLKKRTVTLLSRMVQERGRQIWLPRNPQCWCCSINRRGEDPFRNIAHHIIREHWPVRKLLGKNSEIIKTIAVWLTLIVHIDRDENYLLSFCHWDFKGIVHTKRTILSLYYNYFRGMSLKVNVDQSCFVSKWWQNYIFGWNIASKGLFNQIMSRITHHHVVPNPQDLRLSLKHKLKYFWWNLSTFWPCIDSNTSTTSRPRMGVKSIK